MKRIVLLIALRVLSACTPALAAQYLYLNEILYNPPPTNDTRWEYIELRGTPNATIASGTFLVGIEGDATVSPPEIPGIVQDIFPLGGKTIGANGFLVLLQKNHTFTPNPSASVYTNSGTGGGWGSGSSSSIGHVGEGGNGNIENHSVTFMLIQTGTAPQIGDSIDPNHDGTPNGTVWAGWTVLDSVGVLDETPFVDDWVYGVINFANENNAGDSINPVSDQAFTAKYLGRTGNSIGFTEWDWVAAEVTGNGPGFMLSNSIYYAWPSSPFGDFEGRPLNHIGSPNFGVHNENEVVVINEVKVNPPGQDAASEYVELRGATNGSLAGLYLVALDGESARGNVDWVVNLSPYTLGSNGLAVVVGSGHPYIIPAATTVIVSNDLNTIGLRNGTFSLLLINSATQINKNDDLDSNNDGVLDLFPWAQVFDSIGWSDGGNNDVVYAGANITGLSFTPDAATRFKTNNTPNSAAAWYCGELRGGTNSIFYDFSKVSTNFPAGGILTPGATNDFNNEPVITASLPDISTVLGDPSNLPITFTFSDVETATASLGLSVISGNTAALPQDRITVTGTGGSRTITINPTNICFDVPIIITVNDGVNYPSNVIRYAVSLGWKTNSIFPIGVGDASTALAIDADYMLVGDDETYPIRLFSRTNSGLAIKQWDFTANLGTTNLEPDGRLAEVDIEGSSRTGDRIYWIGSLGNTTDGLFAPNRNRLFATTIAGVGTNTTLTYVGRYDHLRDDLLAWDTQGLHRKGQAYYELQSSAGLLRRVKTPTGLTVEGFTLLNGSTNAAYIAFRTPLVPPAERRKALLVPVTNLADLVSANPSAGPAKFGEPVELDLGGRGIRSIERNGTGYLIVAGAAAPTTDDPLEFRLFTWSGDPLEQPQMRSARLEGMSPEAIVDVPSGPFNDSMEIQLLSDNGFKPWYLPLTNVITKDLVVTNFKKFQADRVILGPVVPLYSPVLVETNLRSGRFVRGTGTNATFHSFVTSLDQLKGVPLDATGGNALTYYPSNDWTNNLQHYNVTNPAAPISFKNPIVAFGSVAGAPPLHLNTTYSFKVGFGDRPQKTSETSPATFAIWVYERGSFQRAGEILITIPVDPWAVFPDFGRKGLAYEDLKFGLRIVFQPSTEYSTSNTTWYITQEARKSEYVFVIAGLGFYGDPASGGSTARPTLVTSASQPWWSPLYVVNFDALPPWRSSFIAQPQFAGEPLPPTFDGKSVQELLNYSANVTNVVSLPQAPSTYTNLDQSPELRVHPTLDRFVADMGNDPLALATYVQNEVELTDAFAYNDAGAISEASVNLGGVNRGALGVFTEGQGSPVEQCALLIYLLRKAGVPAVYMYPEHNGLKLLDTRLSNLLRTRFKGAVNSQGQTSVPELVPVNYPWVAAYVSSNWVHLFPWLKDTEVIEGLNLYDYMPTNCNSGTKWVQDFLHLRTNVMHMSRQGETIMEIFPRFVTGALWQEHPGISIDDLGVTVRNRNHSYATWRDFPRPTLLTNLSYAVESLGVITNTFPTMTNVFDLISVEVSSAANPSKKISSGDFQTADLHNRQFTLWYQETNGNHNMILTLESFRPSTTNRIPFGTFNPLAPGDTNIVHTITSSNMLNSSDDNVIIKMTHKRHRALPDSFSTNPPPRYDAFLGYGLVQPFSPVLEVSQERTVRKGDLVNICLNVGQVSRSMIFEQSDRFWPYRQLVATNGASANSINPEFYRGKFNYLMGMSWFERVNRFRKLSQRLHKAQTVSWYSVALSQLGAKRDANGALLSGFLDLRKPRLDVCYQQIGIAGNGTLHPDAEQDLVYASDDFLELLTTESSMQEQTVISDFYKVKAISTIGALHKAQRTGLASQAGILQLNRTNYQSYGETYYGSYNKKLKEFDPAMWQTISNLFMTPGLSNYAKVFMTPGVVTNSVGKHVGALLFGGNYHAALLSTNISGGEGSDSDGDSEQTEVDDTAGPEGDPGTNEFVFRDKAGGFVDDPSDLGHNIDDGEHQIEDTERTDETDLATMKAIITDNQNATIALETIPELAAALACDPILKSQLITELIMNPFMSPGEIAQFIESNGFLGVPTFYNPPTNIGEPVDVVHGNFYLNEIDLVIPGPWPLEIRRNYTSNNKGRSALGYGWKFAYMPYLVVSAESNQISAAELDGSLIKYSRVVNGLWRPDPALNRALLNPNEAGQLQSANLYKATLTETQDASGTHLILYSPNGSKRTFTWMSFPNTSSTRQRPYLEKWEDDRGNFYLFKYGTTPGRHDYGQLRRIESCNGSSLTFEYGSEAHITSISTTDGRHVNYFYDASDDLVRVVLPDGAERRYEYTYSVLTNRTFTAIEGWIQFTNAEGYLDLRRGVVSTIWVSNRIGTHLLTREIKSDGRILRNEYDKQQRVTNQWATVGLDLRPVINATFVYSNNYSITNSSTNMVSGYTLVLDAFGNTNRYEYTNGLLTKVVDPLGQASTTEWYFTDDSSGGYRRSVKQRTDRRGMTTFFLYDTNGNVVTNIISGPDLTGAGATNAVYSFSYNDNRLTTVVAPLGNQTAVYYASNYPGLPEYVVSLAPPPFNFAIFTNYFEYLNITNVVWGRTNTSFGLLRRAIQAIGTSDAATNEFAYEARGYPTQHVQYTGTSDPNVVRTFVYNARGELAASADAAGRTTKMDYDPAGRPQTREVYEVGSSVPVSWEQTYYNLNGEVTWTDGPRFDPEDYTWSDYDGAGRRTAVIRWRTQAKADGSGVQSAPGDDGFALTRQEFDLFGNLRKVIDPRGVTIASDYDALGHQILVKIVETNGTLLRAEQFAYEPGGQVTFHTNALGGVTETQYTSTGKPKYRKTADGSTNALRYDLNGRLTKEIQRNGAYWETTYYDASRQVTRVFRRSDGTALFSTEFQLDRRGNVIWILDSSGFARTNAYDCLNRPKWTVGPVLAYTHPAGAPAIPGGPPAYTQQAITNYFDAAGLVITNVNALGDKVITYFDAIGRATQTEIRDRSNVLVRVTSAAYAANHHSLTVTNGSSSSAVASTAFTDNDGNTILSIGYPGTGAKQFVRRKFDLVGNVSGEAVASVTNGTLVEWQSRSFIRDGLNRLVSTLDSDGAVTILGYDALGNETNRIMPGGVSWHRRYSSAGQLLEEYDLGVGGVGTRTNTFAYYASGPFVGLLQNRSDSRGVTCAYTYDDFLRPTTNTHSGPLAEQNMITTFAYDHRGLLTNVVESFTNVSIGPSTSVWRSYDAYGQLTNEIVDVGGNVLSSPVQSWDSAGRRMSLGLGTGVFGFNHFWRADGLLGSLQTPPGSGNYGYDSAGHLDNRDIGGRTTQVTQRDGMGRPMGTFTTAGAEVALEESMSWTGDGLVASHTLARSDFTDSRQYIYGSQNRRLVEERLNLDSIKRYTNSITYDNGQSGGPGVPTRIGQPESSGTAWKGVTDAFARISSETNNVIQQPAWGNVNAPALVSAALDQGAAMPTAVFGTNGGPWRANLELTPGTHQLVASALHPSGIYRAAVTNYFTNNLGNLTGTDTLDGAGNVTQKVWKNPNGTTNLLQTLAWDARNRLVRVIERDGTQSGKNWSAVYDPFDRLVRTTEFPVTNGVTNVAFSVVVEHYYDPEYEFLEMGVRENGVVTWKVLGPDLDGTYGGLNGTGGFEAIVPAPGVFQPVVADALGNNHAVYDLGQNMVMWHSSRLTGYGAVPGYRPVPLGSSGINLAAKYAWRNRPFQSVGYVWMGENWYDPTSAQFLGHDVFSYESSLNGRTPYWSNPLAYYDPDGRAPYDPSNPSTWTRMPVPGPDKGYWTGTPGDSPFRFHPDSPKYKIFGPSLDYVKGVPNLDPWQVNVTINGISVEGRIKIDITGTADRKTAIRAIAKKYELPFEDVKDAVEGKQFHHWHNNEMVLVPEEINKGISHIGPASAARARLLDTTGRAAGRGLKVLMFLGLLDAVFDPGALIAAPAGGETTLGDATMQGYAQRMLNESTDPYERLKAYEFLDGGFQGRPHFTPGDVSEFIGLQLNYSPESQPTQKDSLYDQWNPPALCKNPSL